MKRIETAVIIEASSEKVWNKLMDFESYSLWNPFIVQLNGVAIKGSNLEAHLKLENQKKQIFKPKIIALVEQREFRWLGRLFVPGIFDGEHYFLLEPQEFGRVKLTHGEKFTGLLAGLLHKLIGAATKRGFEAMNQALKQSIEVNLNS